MDSWTGSFVTSVTGLQWELWNSRLQRFDSEVGENPTFRFRTKTSVRADILSATAVSVRYLPATYFCGFPPLKRRTPPRVLIEDRPSIIQTTTN